MLRLAVISLCAIGLLSGCSDKDVAPRVLAGRGPPDVSLLCPGKDVDTGKWKLANKKQTVVFHTDGRCDLSKLYFDTPDPQYPPGFTQRVVHHNDKSISYTYDGSQIPDPGYTFHYENDYALDGNGSGIIK